MTEEVRDVIKRIRIREKKFADLFDERDNTIGFVRTDGSAAAREIASDGFNDQWRRLDVAPPEWLEAARAAGLVITMKQPRIAEPPVAVPAPGGITRTFINHAPCGKGDAFQDRDGIALVLVRVLRVEDIGDEDQEAEANPFAERYVVCDCRPATSEEAAQLTAQLAAKEVRQRQEAEEKKARDAREFEAFQRAYPYGW